MLLYSVVRQKHKMKIMMLGRARQDIEARNRLRAEVRLPPVSMAQELRKLYNAEHQAAFEAFFTTSPLRQRLETKLLARVRRQLHQPEWRPTGMLSGGGLAFSLHTRKLMRRIWRRPVTFK